MLRCWMYPNIHLNRSPRSLTFHHDRHLLHDCHPFGINAVDNVDFHTHNHNLYFVHNQQHITSPTCHPDRHQNRDGYCLDLPQPHLLFGFPLLSCVPWRRLLSD